MNGAKPIESPKIHVNPMIPLKKENKDKQIIIVIFTYLQLSFEFFSD
jgi:hypothetical protein